jgi:3-hydroxyisobutyrate dehydrogenase-like beta-hydroxyacid dehydrogenase
MIPGFSIPLRKQGQITLTMKLAFIGAGNMGSPMARNLLRAGHHVTVYNRTRAHAEPLRQEGAALAGSPADAARDADAIVTMLADDQAVEQTVQGFLEALAPGALHIGMSTISVACSKRLAEWHAARGQVYVAAPVFGRPVAAAAAKLWIVAAGSPGSIERCQPVFDALARGTSVVGTDPWLANAVKLSGNFLIAAAVESLGEAFALVRKSGVDAGQFLEIINSALFNSPLYGGYGAAIAKEQFEPAGFKLRLSFKDLRLVQEAAESAAVPMPIAGVLRDRFLAAMARGEGDLDLAALARIAAVQAGL